ncbi:MAG: LPXTG cell wall anchor domain-containing protein [Magnetococcales bacterium]|nr:LPXTG cell wall anchor domain-containing protein [Magnetococcales bacterium]
MGMNRIEGASMGFNEMVADTGSNMGWILVAAMFILAFFLGGYLFSRRKSASKKKKIKR